jgi:hypothetical protein
MRRDSPREETLRLALAACTTLLAEARERGANDSDAWTVEELEELIETLAGALDAEVSASRRHPSGRL